MRCRNYSGVVIFLNVLVIIVSIAVIATSVSSIISKEKTTATNHSLTGEVNRIHNIQEHYYNLSLIDEEYVIMYQYADYFKCKERLRIAKAGNKAVVGVCTEVKVTPFRVA